MLRPSLACLFALVAASAQAQPQALPAEQLAKIKAATVFVKVSLGGMSGSGSGFVVQAGKDFGLVVTNHHVVEPPADRRGRPGQAFPRGGGNAKPQIEVVFNSGSPATEWTVPGEVIYEDKADDIALLKVRASKSIPEPLSLVGADKLPETSTVYVCGFPFGEDLAVNDRNPEISVGLASVSSNRTDADGNVVTVQLNGALNPGNSGGPVVTPDGKLVGVAVRTVLGAGIGFAVPPAMVRKAVADVRFALPRVAWKDNNKTLRLEYPADAGDRLGNLVAFVAPADTATVPKDVAKLPASASYPVAAAGGGYAVEFPVPAGAFAWVQFAWTDAAGRRTGRAVRLPTDPAAGSAGGREAPDPRQAGADGFEEMRRFRDFQTNGPATVGRTFRYPLLIAGVIDETVRGGDGEKRDVKQLVVADRFGRRVRELRLYVRPEFAEKLEAALKADGRAKVPAEVTFLAVRFERYATDATATAVAFCDDAFAPRGWSATGDPADLGVRVTPIAGPVGLPPARRPDPVPPPRDSVPEQPREVRPQPQPQQPPQPQPEAVRPQQGGQAENEKRPQPVAVEPPAEDDGPNGIVIGGVAVTAFALLGLVGWIILRSQKPAARGGRGLPVARRDRDEDDDEDDRPSRRPSSRWRDDDEDDRPRSRRRPRLDDGD